MTDQQVEAQQLRAIRRRVRDVLKLADCERALQLSAAGIATVSDDEQLALRALRAE